MQNFIKKHVLKIIVIFVCFLPYSVLASTVYLETTRTEFFVGDTILVDVKVDSENKEINAIESDISLEYKTDAIVIKDLSLSGSDFSLWPNKPLLSEDLKTISLVGGAPNGLKSQNAKLFTIALNLKKPGQIVLHPKNISVYLNDGQATRDSINVRDLSFDVLPAKEGTIPVDEWHALVTEDKTPPKPFKIVAGQDNSVFEGKKFLSFNTIDEQSGIKYYEVKEGDLSLTRSSGTYILQEQDKLNKIIVSAYDAAGNTRTEIYDPNLSYANIVVISIFVVLLLAILVMVILKKRKKNEII